MSELTVEFDTGRSIHFSLRAKIATKILPTLSGQNIFGTVYVSSPENYRSKLTDALKLHDEKLAKIIFQIENNTLLINIFQVCINDPSFRPLATKEEMNAMKGLGKILLCKFLEHCLEENLIQKDWPVELEAMPFLSCNFDEDKSLFDMYEEVYTNEQALEYVAKYPKINEIMLRQLNGLNQAEQRKTILYHMCFIFHLLSLVDYYKKLSFKPDVKSEKMYTKLVKMSSTVSKILKQCE